MDVGDWISAEADFQPCAGPLNNFAVSTVAREKLEHGEHLSHLNPIIGVVALK